jgi:hypothetical protein
MFVVVVVLIRFALDVLGCWFMSARLARFPLHPHELWIWYSNADDKKDWSRGKTTLACEVQDLLALSSWQLRRESRRFVAHLSIGNYRQCKHRGDATNLCQLLIISETDHFDIDEVRWTLNFFLFFGGIGESFSKRSKVASTVTKVIADYRIGSKFREW